MRNNELPLVAMITQEIDYFFVPGFPFPSGLIINNSK